ncbi:lipopolysaccharide biosynthesis protein [Bradyrhizobium sp. Ec3.3]|uniref:lipopolysaccharide biosynthesis protein n=1 Tax=Bradyrhizobium sp. Ec3.3 TaxID=189753 RepID=UPI00040C0F4E|nr:lipopolysaccharide biosynthesis protein [Bradyrhizobium sp. Ec3.3]
MDRDSKSRAATNILITGGSQAWKLCAGFLLTIVSTRNLAASDFGLLAMSATAATFVGLFKDLGVGQAIVQRPEIAKGQIDALFWLSVLASAASALVLALSAYPIALLYDDPRLQRLTIAIAGLSFIAGLPTVPAALLARDSQFKALAILDVVATTASVVAGLVAVIMLRDYWALYLSTLVLTLFSTVGIWACSGYRPSYPHLDSEARHMARFGLHVSGFNLVNYFSRNADNILIGKFRGSAELGLYDRAYKLLLFPIIQLHNPIGQVIVPLLSRLRSDKEKYLSTYDDTLSMVMLVCHPGIIFAIQLSEPLFRFVLGEQWVGAAPIFSWLGFAGLIQVATATAAWLFLSQGRSQEYFRLGIWTALINVMSFLIGLPWGALGIAIAYTLVNYAIVLPLYAISIGRSGPVTTRSLIQTTGPHWIGCLVAAAATRISTISLLDGNSPAELAMLLTLAYASYLAAIILFAQKRALARRVLRSGYQKVRTFSEG